MPKRVIDFDAMWGSDKLAACAAWAQAEYAWLYGLADASGCFELTNLRVIWGRVAAIRENLTIERLEQVFAEFQDKGLLFVWEHEGKRYAHWTGSDVPGRLPPPSWRMRLEKFAPPVPRQQLAEYMARFARGRAALAGGGFRVEAARDSFHRNDELRFEFPELKPARERSTQDGNRVEQGKIADGCGFKGRVEEAPGQDLGLGWNLNGNLEGNLEGKWNAGRDLRRGGAHGAQDCRMAENRKRDLEESTFYDSRSNANPNSNADSNPNPNANSDTNLNANSNSNATSYDNPDLHLHPQLNPKTQLDSNSPTNPNTDSRERPNVENANCGDSRAWNEGARNSWFNRWREKDLAVARELRVGQGPVCGPSPVKPEVLERIRRREEARAARRS